jgi:hypothetical protein
MGLHRDGTTFGLTAVDTHVRRLIWYQICFLDVRTCEATGPRPQIRKEEYDTKLPLNVNDTDLMTASPPTDDLPYWTDMTLSKLKFECYELIRQLWVDMQRMDQKKLSLTSVLNRIKKFRATTEAKYSPLVQGNTPKQILAKQMYRASSNRALVVILQRYAVGTNYPMPERLRNLLIEACMGTVEAGVAMETRPELATWAWYRGAILQYHAAVLLVFEVYARPDMPEAARIWSSVDYIFETPPQASQIDKAEGIIITLRDRLEKYHSVRKLRATADVESQSSPGPSTTPQLNTPVTAPHITRSAQTFTTPTMVYSQLPHTEQGPASDASGSHTGVNRDSSADPGMEAVANMDWVSQISTTLYRDLLTNLFRMSGTDTLLPTRNWGRLERWGTSASAISILTKHTSRFRELMLINDEMTNKGSKFCGHMNATLRRISCVEFQSLEHRSRVQDPSGKHWSF